jgi:predicted nucleotidyltransferase
MLDIREKDHKTLCNIAKECFKTPIEIWAYGSRVNGDNHDASDLDLVIRTADLAPLDFRELFDFQEQLQESNIPILVQVMDWNKIPESFHSNILKNYEVLYSSEHCRADFSSPCTP